MCCRIQASPVVLLPNCAGWLNGEDSSKLHLFRLYVASEEEAASNVSSRFIRPFSVDNEIAALRAAITVIEDAVNRVDTTTDNPQNGSDGIEVVRKQIADLYRQGQSVVLRRHYNRVKLVLDLQFHGRVTGQYSFPPSSAAQWVRAHATASRRGRNRAFTIVVRCDAGQLLPNVVQASREQARSWNQAAPTCPRGGDRSVPLLAILASRAVTK